MSVRGAIAFAAILVWSQPLVAGDKSQYGLANPTPDTELRELTTDRPDLTESPMTVDAGRLQVEVNAFGYARARADSDGAESETYEYGTTNLRIGVTANSELNIVWQPYGLIRTDAGSERGASDEEGIGGLEIRGKLNLLGNDAFEAPGDTALAILPFVSFPTDSGNGISPDDVEGGVIVPFALQLPLGFGIGFNAGAAFVKDDEGSGYHAEATGSAALAYTWGERLGTYYEIATVLGRDDPRGDILLLGTGFTYAIGQNVQLDGGINFGVTSASDRIAPFVGMTWRR